MININNIKEVLKDNTKISVIEKAALNKTTAETYVQMKDAINKQNFKLGTAKAEMKLEDIVKNFDTATNTITVGKEKVSVDRSSNLAVWIQIFLIANGKNIYVNKSGGSGKTLDIDGKIGQATKAAISNYQNPGAKGEVTPNKIPEAKKLDTDSLQGIDIKDYKIAIIKNIGAIKLNELPLYQSKKYSFNRAKSDGILSSDYKLNDNYKIDTNKKTLIITTKNLTHTVESVIFLKDILNENVGVDKNKFAEKVLAAIESIYYNNESKDSQDRVNQEKGILKDQYKIPLERQEYFYKNIIAGRHENKSMFVLIDNVIENITSLKNKAVSAEKRTKISGEYKIFISDTQKVIDTYTSKSKEYKRAYAQALYNDVSSKKIDTKQLASISGKTTALTTILNDIQQLQQAERKVKEYMKAGVYPSDHGEIIINNIKESLLKKGIEWLYLSASKDDHTKLDKLEKEFNFVTFQTGKDYKDRLAIFKKEMTPKHQKVYSEYGNDGLNDYSNIVLRINILINKSTF